MSYEKKAKIRSSVIEKLKTIYDPEMGINIYDLGLIYGVDVKGGKVVVEMTFTSYICPFSEILLEEVKAKASSIEEIKDVLVEVTFDPPWDKEMMSEAGRLEAGLW